MVLKVDQVCGCVIDLIWYINADLGGILGLYCGATVITLFEICVFFTDLHKREVLIRARRNQLDNQTLRVMMKQSRAEESGALLFQKSIQTVAEQQKDKNREMQMKRKESNARKRSRAPREHSREGKSKQKLLKRGGRKHNDRPVVIEME